MSPMVEDGLDPVGAALERHEHRRRQGLPTVSVLAGPAARAVSAWRAFARRTGRTSLTSYGSTPSDLAATWLQAAARHADLADAALHSCGSELEETRAFLRSASAMELRTFCDRAALRGATRRIVEATAAGSLIADAAVGRAPGPDDVVEVAEMLAWSDIPALLVMEELERVADQAEAVVELCVSAPRLAIALATPAGALASCLERKRDSRVRAILREGLIELAPESATASVGEPGEALRRPPHPVESHGRHLSALRAALDRGDGDRARSAAERLLYQALEAHVETTGLFELNGRLTAYFGPAPAEVDLLARSISFALEIDGPHHFREPAAYRRDRRKDLLLQEQGYIVARVLAEDVADDLDAVVELVVAAVVRRKRAVKSGNSS